MKENEYREKLNEIEVLLNDYLPQDAKGYTRTFRELAAITNASLAAAEQRTDWISAEDKSRYLDRLAKAVETVASLRGDGGIFYDHRPSGTQLYQKEMYATEDMLRDKLMQLGYEYPRKI